MTTKQNQKHSPFSIGTGYEGEFSDEFTLPSCTIEDLDRAIFNLFDKELSFEYELNGDVNKVPVIFATGERFAVLRRKQPIRDRTGALILPVISIMRSNIEQRPSGGTGINDAIPEHVIRRKLSSRDPEYQAVLNKIGISNQDNIPSDRSHVVSGSTSGPAIAGRFAVRNFSQPTTDTTTLLEPSLDSRHIYEIITVASPKFFQASYDITLWCQYTQQMNDMVTKIMSSYTHTPSRSFKVESDKGYWFTAFVDSSLSSESNYDDFTDEERIIRYSFTLTSTGYIINPSYPGAKPAVRKHYSLPSISFDMTYGDIPEEISKGGPRTTNPNQFLLEDLELDKIQSDRVGGSTGVSSDNEIDKGTSVGGYSDNEELQFAEDFVSVSDGSVRKRVVKVVSKNRRKGETIFTESFIKR